MTDWNARAATYDALPWVHDEDLLGWTAKHVLDAVRPAVERTGIDCFLEVGCGTGALTERLGQAGLRGHACDISREMLERAQARLGSRYPIGFFQTSTAGPYERAPKFSSVVSRMMLHHAPVAPAVQVARWVDAVEPGGCVVVAEGPPPRTDDRHPACDLYRAAMALKEPGRHVFHAHDVAEWLLDAGCDEVRVVERWTHGNSVRAWLAGGGIEAGRAEAILALHREAPVAAREAYRIKETEDGDVRMSWRHCVVTGIRS